MESLFDKYPGEATDCPPFRFCLTNCWDAGLADSSTGPCFQLAWSLIAFGLFFILIAELLGRVNLGEAFFTNMITKLKYVLKDNSEAAGDELNYSVDITKEDGFVKLHRKLENFVKNNSDPSLELPPPYTPEYTNIQLKKSVYPVTGFFPDFLRSTTIGSRLFLSSWLGSLGWAMICSAVSTLLWNLINYEKICYEDATYVRDWLLNVGRSFNLVRGDYDFFPVFLLVGYLGYVASRWREFMVNCHTIQARLHDTALLCGGAVAVKTPSLEVRERLYTIYRYLNLIHALCYKSVSPTVGPLDLESDFVDSLGLLRKDELADLLPMDNKIRDTVITWLASEVSMLLRMDDINPAFAAVPLAQAIAGIRGITARHHDLFIRDNPNLYLHLMLLIVNLLMVLVIVSYPFSLVVLTPNFFSGVGLPCFQPVCLAGVFVLLSSFRTAYSLVVRLRNPFSWTNDRIKVDNLMASSDRAIFAMLRATFRGTTEDVAMPLTNRQNRPLRRRRFSACVHHQSSGLEGLVPLEEVRDI